MKTQYITKMRRLFLLYVSAGWILSFICNPAFAITGNELFDQIKSGQVSENLRAAAYIEGVIEAEASHIYTIVQQPPNVGSFKKVKGNYFCLPEGVTNGQALDIVAKYLSENPEYRNLTASVLVRLAILRVWACTGAEKP